MYGCIGSRRYVLMDSQEWLSYLQSIPISPVKHRGGLRMEKKPHP